MIDKGKGDAAAFVRKGDADMHHERVRRERSADGAMIAEVVTLSNGKPKRIIALFRYFAKDALRAEGMNGRMQSDIDADRRFNNL